MCGAFRKYLDKEGACVFCKHGYGGKIINVKISKEARAIFNDEIK